MCYTHEYFQLRLVNTNYSYGHGNRRITSYPFLQLNWTWIYFLCTSTAWRKNSRFNQFFFYIFLLFPITFPALFMYEVTYRSVSWKLAVDSNSINILFFFFCNRVFPLSKTFSTTETPKSNVTRCLSIRSAITLPSLSIHLSYQ